MYSRRVFYLRPGDRSAIRDGIIPNDKHVVDPATILPTKLGAKPQTSEAGPRGKETQAISRQNAGSLDDDVMQWLDDGMDPSSSAAASKRRDLDDDRAAFSNHPWLRESLGELVPVGSGEPIRLNEPRITIGRLDECDVTIAKSSISAVHCELFIEGGYWFVRDQNSTNGVRVNDQRVEPDSPTRVEPGASLAIAKEKFILRYQPEKLGAEPDS
jgi:pSer/pThr/pTyr-binding forkhead associated (FHA) protein